MEKIISLAKRRGFIYQGSEIYGGLAGTWDYGPLGVALKNNLKNLWWKMFVTDREDMYGIDAAILMNQNVWKASGHVAGFADPLVECQKCHHRFRADQLTDAKKCPDCGGALGEVRQFNMMFKTNVGATGPAENAASEDPSVSYLRPETAQGMFVNFKNVIDSFHPDLPFGLAQIGKAFRNEIAPRDFLFRSREFEQMEIEYFVRPNDWERFFEEFRKLMLAWTKLIGLSGEHLYELEVPGEDRAHYSKRTIDFEFEYPFGRKELYGLAYRTDFDLSAHAKASGQKLEYFDEQETDIAKRSFVPHVIEPSFGVDRTILAILCDAYTEDELGGEKRSYLKLAPTIAPIRAAVFPLLKNKPPLVEKARQVYANLRANASINGMSGGAIAFDDNGNIGKRYRRQDEIGTPYCITVDFQTLEDDTVTLRDRDSGEQKRVNISELVNQL